MSAPLEVFCCYAREDQAMVEQLKKHLTPLQRQGQITIWSDTNLNAGIEWEKELHQHLESASIILLLISPDFLASDYCYSTEMDRALARHNEGSTVVIPILLRSVFWQNAPFARLQMLPTDAKPVTAWANRDDALHDVTVHLHQSISQLQATRTQAQPSAQHGSSSSPALSVKPLVISEPTEHLRYVTSLAFSPDSKILASGSKSDRTTILWDIPSGRKLHTLDGITYYNGGKPSLVTHLAISPDGQILASGRSDGSINLWKLPSGRGMRTLRQFMSSEIRGLAFSPDAQILTCSDERGTVRLCDIPSGRERDRVEITGYIYRTILSPDGKTLACYANGPVQLWDVPTRKRVYEFPHTNSDIAFSFDGKLFALVSYKDTIKLWETAHFGQQPRTLTGHTSACCLAFSPDGKFLASGDTWGKIKLWELSSGRQRRAFRGHNGLEDLAFSPNGMFLAASCTGRIELWKLK